MNYADTIGEPHALYRIYSGVGDLLYVGCSKSLCSRLAVHSSIQPWYRNIACIKVEWFDNAILGRRAEAAAILSENPKYNRLRCEPDAVGIDRQEKLDQRPRGDGTHCPKCGDPIENKRPGKAYCDACFREYRQQRRLRQRAEGKGETV